MEDKINAEIDKSARRQKFLAVMLVCRDLRGAGGM